MLRHKMYWHIEGKIRNHIGCFPGARFSNISFLRGLNCEQVTTHTTDTNGTICIAVTTVTSLDVQKNPFVF